MDEKKFFIISKAGFPTESFVDYEQASLNCSADDSIEELTLAEAEQFKKDAVNYWQNEFLSVNK